MEMNLDGFMRNADKDYAVFRQKLSELLQGALDDGVMEESDVEQFLQESDDIHGNVTFLVETIKHNKQERK